MALSSSIPMGVIIYQLVHQPTTSSTVTKTIKDCRKAMRDEKHQERNLSIPTRCHSNATMEARGAMAAGTLNKRVPVCNVLDRLSNRIKCSDKSER